VIKKTFLFFLFFYKRSRRPDRVVDSSTCGSCDNWEEMIEELVASRSYRSLKY